MVKLHIFDRTGGFGLRVQFLPGTIYFIVSARGSSPEMKSELGNRSCPLLLQRNTIHPSPAGMFTGNESGSWGD